MSYIVDRLVFQGCVYCKHAYVAMASSHCFLDFKLVCEHASAHACTLLSSYLHTCHLHTLYVITHRLLLVTMFALVLPWVKLSYGCDYKESYSVQILLPVLIMLVKCQLQGNVCVSAWDAEDTFLIVFVSYCWA